MIPFAVLAIILQAQPSAAPSPAAPSPKASPPAAAAPSPVIVRPSVAPVTPPPAPEVVFGLVRKTTAFSADSGRTALRATPTAPASIPGIDDKGYFIEIQWSDKAGAVQSGIAVVAHATVLEVPWVVKPEGGEWGLVQVMEGKSIPAVLDELKRTRIAANEAMAVTDLKTLMTGQSLIMGLTNGVYGEFRCMNRPSDCIKDIPEEQMLEKSYLAIERNGYRRKFHAGEKVTDNPRSKGGPFLKTYAFTAVPITPGETGVRSFCGDHTGRVCVKTEGGEPAVTGGSCANPCTELKSEAK